MWTIDQEWRDQVIAQLIYLRTAIYFVAFVVSVGFAAPYARASMARIGRFVVPDLRGRKSRAAAQAIEKGAGRGRKK